MASDKKQREPFWLGGAAACMAVILVRMCADGAKAPAQQFQYSNAIDALARVYRDEGMGAFWKGLTPNIARSVLMSEYVSQIATYSSTKQYLTGHLGFGDDTKTHAISSLMAGTMATTLCAPADVLKSRIQSSAGKEGLLQVLRSGLREEGALFLMRGWTPAWLRLTYVSPSPFQTCLTV
ncbi:uncharacterized protein NECHADRAFT_50632 [Fusarium vanettenii 77-13-4]|uniref:Mitochondrial carrier protein n=1 Tax=Fusarium vanettenii (strain ATCC MYA-4622 / CBS 123669 / FGSC 9596 / NRRL 45880 / 77-13-4) TaxID=660122 RepID=C7Z1E2_FUSV7|nr:uncharacterized protein NECHADRAFT_50632 [Fusarium vanettenii 77-13-4]EEU42155.1 hypothetical protein NECHADRAFT_50632 [Fusarium vanettenii 77-13-4]